MRVSVFGLGYVGCASAVCLSRDSHDVVGVDVDSLKVDMVSCGESPIAEAGISKWLSEAVTSRHLRATSSPQEAIASSDVSLICVGTPSSVDGSPDLAAIRRVCREIGEALRDKTERHTVVMRSTVMPGTIENVVVPIIDESSGQTAGDGYGVCMNPEFLREGTSLEDFYAPPFTLVGADDELTAATVRKLYTTVDAPLITTTVKTAEMVKYACNAFHALKVSFANEIGSLCKAMEIDSHEVMDVFCQDTKLNLSHHYLRPGAPFGGSCLPKDVRALTHQAKELDLETPVLSAILPSNRLHHERALELVLRRGKKRVGILGFSFKAGTDDLREAPMVSLVEALIDNGLEVLIYDEDVSLARLVGSNRAFIDREVPHVAALLCDSLEEVLREAELIVIAKKSDEFRPLETQLGDEHQVIDLVRLFDRPSHDSYEGICW